MCVLLNPIDEFEVTEERYKRAVATVNRVTDPTDPKRLRLHTVVDVFLELGWPNCVAYLPEYPDPDERLVIRDMMSIQVVALAAALASVYETQGTRVLAT